MWANTKKQTDIIPFLPSDFSINFSSAHFYLNRQVILSDGHFLPSDTMMDGELQEK